MSASGPWSVKGIDPRARARAKTAARREGVTLGEWLNRVILDDSDPTNPGHPQWDDALEGFPGFGGSGPALEPDEDRLLRAMVNRLTERVESSEQMSTHTLQELDKAITQLADKVVKSSDHQSEEIKTARDAIDRVRKNQDELTDRVRTLETNPASGSSPEDRKAFETTIMKLARRLYEHENDTAARLHASDEDTRRLSESLEDRLKRLEARAEDFTDLNKKREDRTAQSLNALQTATETLRSRVEGAERVTNDAARTLESTVSRLDDRLRQLETRNSTDTVDLERRFDRLSDDVARIIADTRAQVAQAVSGAAEEPRVERLERALAEALGRIDQAERRQTDSMSRLGEEITKLAGAIDRRLTESERRSADALREARSEQALERRLDEVRNENKDAMKRMGDEVTRLGRSLADRIEVSEARASSAVEAATDRMTQMMDRLDERASREDELEDRLRQSEERTAQRIEDALSGVHERMEHVRDETEQVLSPVQRAMTALADRLEAIEQRATVAAVEETDIADDADTESADETADAEAAAAVKAEQTDPEIDTPPAEPIDFDTPLAPPPQAETPISRFDEETDDPFLAGDHTPDAFVEPEPKPARRERPVAEAAPAPDTAKTAIPAAKPEKPKPRPAPRVGATADADFLAAARERSRAGAGYEAQERRERGINRSVLYALPVVALVMLSGAGGLLVWEAMRGDSDTVAANRTAERDFVAQVEAGLAGSESNTEGAAAAYDASVTEPASATRTENTVAPSNVVADASGSITPAATDPVAAAPVTGPAQPPAMSPVATQADADPGPAASRITLESAAADGNPVARYQLGLRALENGDTQTAVILLRRAAEQGVPAAQYRYAKLLETGEGVTIDLEGARRWTERAANAGHRRAMHNLGVMYYYGTGVAQDVTTAARWFQEAALLGLRDSQFNLALLYETGDGVPLSLPDAYAWFSIAGADSADPTAADRAETISEMIQPEALEAARQTAADFTPRPIDGEANGIYQDLPWGRTATADMLMVRRAQGFLSALGYPTGPLDGRMGDQTREAIMAFEADRGLPRTGRVDAVLIERLERAATG